jgi:threonine dehydratase
MRPTAEDVRAAARRIAPHIHRTPVVTSATFDREIGARVFFKCENLQKVGAFKARGAVNAVLGLDAARAARGVIAHSSGNHAAALAYAAGIRRIPAVVVMPEAASPIKIAAVRGYGAEIVFCPRAEREATCERISAERGMSVIHPYEHPDVIAGQGTAALELLEQAADLDVVIAPVGGGGMLTGSALIVRETQAGTAIWGAEPEAADDAYRSLESGVRQPGVANPETLADGLLTGLGRINFEILHELGARVIRVSEAEIVAAARFVLERMKLVVEPSGATVLAAIRRSANELRGKRVGAIFSGGNTDFAWLR